MGQKARKQTSQALTILCTGLGTEKLALLLHMDCPLSAGQIWYMLAVPPRVQAANGCNELLCCCFGRNARLTTILQNIACSGDEAFFKFPAPFKELQQHVGQVTRE